MTTHAPARTTDRPIPSPFTGAGKLWRATFLSHILNPWNMAFALLLPLFMYAMFGMTEAARTTQTGRGNVAAAMVVMMTTYGVILVGGIVANGAKGAGKALKDFSLPISMSFRMFGALLSGLLVTELVYYYVTLSYVIPVVVAVLFRIKDVSSRPLRISL